MRFLAVIATLGQLALAAMAAAVTLTALVLIASLPFPQLLAFLHH